MMSNENDGPIIAPLGLRGPVVIQGETDSVEMTRQVLAHNTPDGEDFGAEFAELGSIWQKFNETKSQLDADETLTPVGKRAHLEVLLEQTAEQIAQADRKTHELIETATALEKEGLADPMRPEATSEAKSMSDDAFMRDSVLSKVSPSVRITRFLEACQLPPEQRELRHRSVIRVVLQTAELVGTPDSDVRTGVVMLPGGEKPEGIEGLVPGFVLAEGKKLLLSHGENRDYVQRIKSRADFRRNFIGSISAATWKAAGVDRDTGLKQTWLNGLKQAGVARIGGFGGHQILGFDI
jgi:hypothetical protein